MRNKFLFCFVICFKYNYLQKVVTVNQIDGFGRNEEFRNKYKCICIHIGEGNGTSLQYSCLENPMDGGAWKAAVHGVPKSWT